MKKLILLALAGFVLSANAFAWKESGGGDLCENKIKSIGLDIQSWILAGGAAGLQLPKNTSLDQYVRGMVREVLAAKASCVSPGENGFPVEIDGTPKTCRFDKTSESSSITCDLEKFMSASVEEQYMLVHHEYAGLAGLENPNADDSTYEISNQISGYLQETIVTKLAVKPSSSEVLCADTIRSFVAKKFPYEKVGAEKHKLVSVQMDKSVYSDATGSVDIEVHGIFDEDAYVARRIFIGADGIIENDKVTGCKNLVVKASYFDPLSE